MLTLPAIPVKIWTPFIIPAVNTLGYHTVPIKDRGKAPIKEIANPILVIEYNF